jgi:hypothetical protein
MELHTSETISDTSNASTNNELSLSFDIANGGTETLYVEDKLITNYEVAKARAESLFLDEGYINKRVSFSTYHIDNLHIGDAIQLDNLLFKVISIKEVIKGAKVSMDIVAERFVPPATYEISNVFVTSSVIYYAMVNEDGYIYGGTQNNGQIYRSIDGVIWALVYDDATFNKVSKITYCEANGYIYASLAGTDTKIIRSINGIDWENCGSLSSVYFSDLIYFNGYMYIATYSVSLGIYTTYIDRLLNPFSFTTMYTFDERIYQFIVKSNYLYFSSFKTGVESVYSSSDGASFAKISNLPLDDYISVMVVNGAYIIGANDTGRIYKSIDGITWEIILNEPLYAIYTMTSNNIGVYVPTNDGKILHSNDLLTWDILYDLSGSVSWLWAITSQANIVYVFDNISDCYTITYTIGGE